MRLPRPSGSDANALGQDLFLRAERERRGGPDRTARARRGSAPRCHVRRGWGRRPGAGSSAAVTRSPSARRGSSLSGSSPSAQSPLDRGVGIEPPRRDLLHRSRLHRSSRERSLDGGLQQSAGAAGRRTARGSAARVASRARRSLRAGGAARSPPRAPRFLLADRDRARSPCAPPPRPRDIMVSRARPGPVGARLIGLVDDEDVGDLEDPGLDGLDVVAHARHQDDRTRCPPRARRRSRPAPRRPSRSAPRRSRRRRAGRRRRPSPARESAEAPRVAIGADEHAGIGGVSHHADPVAEDGAAGEAPRTGPPR